MASSAPQVDARRKRLSVGLAERPVGLGEEPAQVSAPEVLQTLRLGSVVDELGPDGKPCGETLGLALMTTTDSEASRKRPNSEKDRVAVGGTLTTDQLTRQLQEQGVGLACKKGFKPESPNQDSFAVVITDEYRVFGVFDGHGPLGHDVSQFVRENLMKLFLRHPDRDENPEFALTEAFTTTQELLAHLTQTRELDSSVSGTTCTVAYLPADLSYVVTAYVADSRGILCVTPDPEKPSEFANEDLTIDHKPNLEGEKERIEKMGGRVVFDGYYNYRVYSRDGRGGLNMSRALGDCIAHTAGVSPVPDTKTTVLNVSKKDLPPGKDKALLLCTDGVWEFLQSEDAAKLVMGYGRDRAQQAVEELTQVSYDKWMADSEGEVSDDITACLVWL